MWCTFGHVSPQNRGKRNPRSPVCGIFLVVLVYVFLFVVLLLLVSASSSFSASSSKRAVRTGMGLAHGGVRPFHQKSTCLTQLILGPYVVQSWSRNTPKNSPNEALVLHRVAPLRGLYAQEWFWHTVEYGPFIKSQLASSQLTFGFCVVQI